LLINQPNDAEAAMKDALGFFLRRGPSSVPFSGDGLYLVGRVHPGALVCLYPGVVYHPWDISQVMLQMLFDV
jgi:hypothetical protein